MHNSWKIGSALALMLVVPAAPANAGVVQGSGVSPSKPVACQEAVETAKRTNLIHDDFVVGSKCDCEEEANPSKYPTATRWRCVAQVEYRGEGRPD